jgi:hypothetical protein
MITESSATEHIDQCIGFSGFVAEFVANLIERKSEHD